MRREVGMLFMLLLLKLIGVFATVLLEMARVNAGSEGANASHTLLDTTRRMTAENTFILID
jgi:hypothetical protein